MHKYVKFKVSETYFSGFLNVNVTKKIPLVNEEYSGYYLNYLCVHPHYTDAYLFTV